MSYDTFVKVIEKLGPGLCEVYTHGFGEPTLNPDFDHMMAHLVSKGILFGLVTNGATHFFENENKELEWLLWLRPTKVRFSVDAATPKVFEQERFPAKFDRVYGNIHKTVEMNEKLYPGLRGDINTPRIDLYTVLTMHTLTEIGSLIDLRDELGCDWITFSDLAWNNSYGDSVANNAVRQMMTREEMLDLFKPYMKNPRVTFDIPVPNKRTCDYTKFASYVDAEGRFYYCTCVPGKEPPFGNIFDVKNIGELYNGEAGRRFREQSKTGQIPSRECERCLQWAADYSDL